MLIPTPKCVSEITPAWLSQVLNVPIVPETFQLIQNVHEGTGFLSDMGRVSFTTSRNQETTKLILKFPPSEAKLGEGDQSRTLVLRDHFDQIEINSYKDLFPKLFQIIPELEECFCPSIYTEIQQVPDYTSVLILEDLKPKGYFMIGFHEDFGNLESGSYFMDGLDFLAKFHAAATGLVQQDGRESSLVEIFPWFPKSLIPRKEGEDRKVPELHTWFPLGFPAVFQLFEQHPNTRAEMIEAYKKFESRGPEILQRVLAAGQEFPTAIHGDLWTHNILVRKSPRSIKVIDWQMLGYGDPTFDLAIYILEALHLPYLTKENVVKAAQLYFNKYEDILKSELGLPMRRSYAEFEQFFQTYGIGYCIYWLVLGCPDMMTIPACLPKCYRILELGMEFGVIEFLNNLP